MGCPEPQSEVFGSLIPVLFAEEKNDLIFKMTADGLKLLNGSIIPLDHGPTLVPQGPTWSILRPSERSKP